MRFRNSDGGFLVYTSLSILYVIYCLLYVDSDSGTASEELKSTFFIMKTLLMPSLILWPALHSRFHFTKVSGLVVAGLLFSWGGDVLLLFASKGSIYFILGLISFLLAHILYISAMREQLKAITFGENDTVSIILLVMPIVLLVSFLIIVFPGLERPFNVPILFYSFVITAMVLFSGYRYKLNISNASFLSVYGGAILFMFSDFALAVNKFLVPLPMASFFVMTTYLLAQAGITYGMTIKTD